MTIEETRQLASALTNGSLRELHGFLDYESLQLVGTNLAEPHVKLLAMAVGFVLAIQDYAGGQAVSASTMELLLNPNAIVELALAAHDNLAAQCRETAP